MTTDAVTTRRWLPFSPWHLVLIPLSFLLIVPLLGPANLFLMVWLTINALQLFDVVYQTTRGGPLRATTVIVYYLWDRAFVQFDAGYAAAMAYALFVVIVVVTAVQFRVARRDAYHP